MTTPTESVEVTATVIDPTPVDSAPAPGADDQKPNDAADTPAAGADDKKPEEGQQDSPEQKEKRELSRRERARLRDAKALGRAEAERDAAKSELERVKAESTAKPEAGEPKRDDFQDYETYLRAVTKYDAEQVADKRLKADREVLQQAAPQKLPATHEAFIKSDEALQKEAKDYREVIDAFSADFCGNPKDSGQLSPQARQALIELGEVGPKVMYHLGKNSEVAESIAELSPLRQVAKLVELGDTLTKPAQKRESKAPTPPTPVSQGKAGVFNPETASQAEYEAARKAGQLGQPPRWARG